MDIDFFKPNDRKARVECDRNVVIAQPVSHFQVIILQGLVVALNSTMRKYGFDQHWTLNI